MILGLDFKLQQPDRWANRNGSCTEPYAGVASRESLPTSCNPSLAYTDCASHATPNGVICKIDARKLAAGYWTVGPASKLEVQQLVPRICRPGSAAFEAPVSIARTGLTSIKFGGLLAALVLKKLKDFQVPRKDCACRKVVCVKLLACFAS